MTAPMSRDASVGELPVVAWMDDLGSIIFDPRNSRCSRPETFKHDLTTVAAARECIAAQSALADRMAEALRLTLAERTSAARLSNACQFADDVLAEYERSKQ